MFTATGCFAETEMDRQLRIAGLVDSNYKAVNESEYIKFWKNVSRETAKNLPIYLDEDSKITTMSISPNLYLLVMELDIEEDTLELAQPYLNASKNNFCKSGYGESKAIRANGGVTVALLVMNRYYENIFKYKFSSLECPVN